MSAPILLVLSMLFGPAAVDAVPDRPNLILFIVDDMGWQDTSVPFHTERTPFNDRYRTPAMERLAAEGLVFTHAYAASPVCTPTRASILTGQNPARSRITNWTLRGDPSAKHPTLTPPAWNRNGVTSDPATPLALHATTLAHHLHARGYRTIHCGKAHWGAIGTPGADPANLGFDVNIAGHAAGAPASYYGEDHYRKGDESPWNVPGLETYHGTDVNLTEALTIEANRAIDDAVAAGEPFFMNMAHYAVHTPIMVDERFAERYRAMGLPPREVAYASMVEAMDKSLGDIVANLERHGVLDDTIIVFFSDNGGLSAHGRAGRAHTHNAPLRSGKGSAYEGGVRIPMIVRGPGVAAPGARTDAPAISDDLYPTFLTLGGVDPDVVDHPIDGRDLTPLLRGDLAGGERDAWNERPLVFHRPHQWGAGGPGIHPCSALIRGPWKLIHFHATNRVELYNLDQDLGETNDLAERRPDLARELANELGARLRAMGAQMSIDKATGDPVPFPGW